MSAPTSLSAEQQARLRNSPQISKLRERCRSLTRELHRRGYRPIRTAGDHPLYAKKKKADARLNSTKMRLRQKMVNQVREQHFRSADTHALDAQFSSAGQRDSKAAIEPLASPRAFALPERAELVRLTCTQTEELSESDKLARRIQAIEVRAALCGRREARRRKTHVSAFSNASPREAQKHEQSTNPQDATCEEYGLERFPLKCEPTQCTFCLGDESLPYGHRIFAYRRKNKLWDHVENKHFNKIAAGSPVACKHPACVANSVVLASKARFKVHTQKIHGVALRADRRSPPWQDR